MLPNHGNMVLRIIYKETNNTINKVELVSPSGKQALRKPKAKGIGMV